MNVKTYTERFLNQQAAILAEEEQALAEFREDLSNADFVVGEHDTVTALLAVTFVFLLLMSAKTLTQKIAEDGLRPMELLILCLLAFVGLLTLYRFLYQKYRRKIRIFGKTMYYGTDCWEFRQIDSIECSAFGTIRVMIDGKAAAKTSFSDENSGRLLAWAKKCSIRVHNAYREPERLKRRKP